MWKVSRIASVSTSLMAYFKRRSFARKSYRKFGRKPYRKYGRSGRSSYKRKEYNDLATNLVTYKW